MAACQHRPEEGCALVPCADVIEGRVCRCSSEYKAEVVEDEAEEEAE